MRSGQAARRRRVEAGREEWIAEYAAAYGAREWNLPSPTLLHKSVEEREKKRAAVIDRRYSAWSSSRVIRSPQPRVG
jgi:hypothetical protein